MNAENAADASKFSTESDRVLCQDPVIVPSPPRHVGVKDSTKNTVTIAWELPEYDGGDSKLSYVVERLLEDGTWFRCNEKSLADSFQCVVGNLEENQKYEFQVKAVNRAGDSKPVELSEVIARERIGD